MELHNSYDPFGSILSNPTIYNPKLYIGRDDVLYDTETDLYYMHARYYDPEAGRFIMKDPVSGYLTKLIDGGFRIKYRITKGIVKNDNRGVRNDNKNKC